MFKSRLPWILPRMMAMMETSMNSSYFITIRGTGRVPLHHNSAGLQDAMVSFSWMPFIGLLIKLFFSKRGFFFVRSFLITCLEYQFSDLLCYVFSSCNVIDFHLYFVIFSVKRFETTLIITNRTFNAALGNKTLPEYRTLTNQLTDSVSFFNLFVPAYHADFCT